MASCWATGRKQGSEGMRQKKLELRSSEDKGEGAWDSWVGQAGVNVIPSSGDVPSGSRKVLCVYEVAAGVGWRPSPAQSQGLYKWLCKELYVLLRWTSCVGCSYSVHKVKPTVKITLENLSNCSWSIRIFLPAVLIDRFVAAKVTCSILETNVLVGTPPRKTSQAGFPLEMEPVTISSNKCQVSSWLVLDIML